MRKHIIPQLTSVSSPSREIFHLLPYPAFVYNARELPNHRLILTLSMSKETRKTMITLAVNTPTPPPAWALLERELLRAQTLGIQEYYEHYFDERGYLLCIPRWGGND